MVLCLIMLLRLSDCCGSASLGRPERLDVDGVRSSEAEGDYCNFRRGLLLDKFENGQFRDRGRTERRHILARRFVWIGKEANRVGDSGESAAIRSAVERLAAFLILPNRSVLRCDSTHPSPRCWTGAGILRLPRRNPTSLDANRMNTARLATLPTARRPQQSGTLKHPNEFSYP